MECEKKALFVLVNAGFAEEIVDMARAAGARGATVIKARGTGAPQKSFMGISVDCERDMILTLVDRCVADKIMADVKEKAGLDSPARGFCFFMPVEKMLETQKIMQ